MKIRCPDPSPMAQDDKIAKSLNNLAGFAHFAGYIRFLSLVACVSYEIYGRLPRRPQGTPRNDLDFFLSALCESCGKTELKKQSQSVQTPDARLQTQDIGLKAQDFAETSVSPWHCHGFLKT